jgi:Phage tail lysozyme
MESFIFGKGTPWTYEELQRKRAIADELAKANMGTARNVGEGIASVGRALAFRNMSKKANKRDAELKGEFDAQYAGAFGGGGGGGGYDAPAFSGAPLPPVDPNNPHILGDDAMAALGKPAVKTAADPASIKAGLVARGLPEHVAEGFVMNFKDESGLNPGINEAAPTVPGSRGGYGLYQLTGPRRVAYENFAAERGVDPSDVDAQLDFLMTELQGPESRAAEAILSTKDAGSAGAAIVNSFLRPAEEHRASREAKYTGGGGYSTSASGSGMDIGTIAELASNPYATPGQKAVLSALMQQQMDAMDPMQQIELQKAQLELEQMQNPQDDPLAAIELEQKRLDLEQDRAGTGADPATYGTSLQFFTGQDGELRAGLTGNDGTFKEVSPPDGGSWATGVDKVDAGTKWIFFNKRTGEQVGEQIKDVRGEEQQKALGKGEGTTQADAAAALGGNSAMAALIDQQINDLKNDPYLPNMLGPIDSRKPNISEDAARVQARIDQLQGGAFLQARQLLKGGGAITDFEGQKAERAFVRMNAAQNEADFKAALDEFNAAVQEGVRKLEAQAGGGAVAPAGDAAPADDGIPTFNPQTGEWE